jgi:hypothetical protein
MIDKIGRNPQRRNRGSLHHHRHRPLFKGNGEEVVAIDPGALECHKEATWAYPAGIER